MFLIFLMFKNFYFLSVKNDKKILFKITVKYTLKVYLTIILKNNFNFFLKVIKNIKNTFFKSDNLKIATFRSH